MSFWEPEGTEVFNNISKIIQSFTKYGLHFKNQIFEFMMLIVLW
jgi:hypothetical protein